MKRVIFCADGTWNVRDQVDKATKKRHPSNVTKVARAIRPRASTGIDQVVYYHDGVGTAGGLDRFTGGAFGEGIEANIASSIASSSTTTNPATTSTSSASAAGHSPSALSRGS